MNLDGKTVKLQTASAVLAYSRMLFIQMYPRFRRFEVKVCLTQAFRFFGGCARRVLIDNSTVIAGRGTGASMVPAPEMEAFAERFGFVFRAHAVGDANRSARVERPFGYVEGNSLDRRKRQPLSKFNCVPTMGLQR